MFNLKYANRKIIYFRFHFMTDLRESVSEATEMEQLRIELELDKQNGGGKSFLGKNWYAANCENVSNGVKFLEENSNITAQRDSGLPDLDQPSISSLSSTCTPQQLHEHKDLSNTVHNDEDGEELGDSTNVCVIPSSIESNFTTHNSVTNSFNGSTRFRRFMSNQASSDVFLNNSSGSSSGSTSTLPSSIATFNSSNSVTSAYSVTFGGNTNGITNSSVNSASISLRKNPTDRGSNSQGIFYILKFMKFI